MAPPVSALPGTLGALHARFREIAAGRRTGDDSDALHAAILTRLALIERLAAARGWSACRVERIDGDLHLSGIAPREEGRRQVPDFASS